MSVLLSITYNSILVDEREIKKNVRYLNSKRLPHIAFLVTVLDLFIALQNSLSTVYLVKKAPTITDKLPGSTVN